MKLDDLPKKNIYQVPDRYFDQLPGRVMARVREKESANNPVAIFLWGHQLFLRSALAGLALVLCFALLYTINTTPPNPSANSEALLSSISEKEALEFLMASHQLDAQDLTHLPASDQDLSHEFIQVSQQDIIEAVENEDLEDIYIY